MKAHVSSGTCQDVSNLPRFQLIMPRINPMGLIRNRGGEGAGFSAGPADNLFGTTSGDVNSTPLVILPAANKADAETVRDTYFTANPTNLATYDMSGNEALGVIVYYSSGGNLITTGQTRVSGAWRDSASTIGIQGLPGSGTDFSGISDNHLPAIGVGPDKIPYDSGIEILGDGSIRSLTAMKLPGGGALQFDNNDLSSGGTVSGGAKGIRFTNLTDLTTDYLIGVPFSEAGSGTPSYDKFGAGFDLPSSADKSDNRLAAFDFINPLPGIVTEYTVSRAAGSATLTDCNFIIWLEGYNTGVPLFDYKDSNPGGGGFTLVAGENVVSTPVPIGFPANADPLGTDQVRLYSHVVDSTGNVIELDGQVITIPADPDPRAEQQWLPYLERHVHFSENVTLQDAIDHPTTIRRDMPDAEMTGGLLSGSVGQNSAQWTVSTNQLESSNRDTATIYALEEGILDVDGNQISLTPVDSTTVRLRAGTDVRIFGVNDFRVVSSSNFLLSEGSRNIITDVERATLERVSGLGNHKTINLTDTYTATAADFLEADTVLFSFTSLNGQKDFNIPASVVPDNSLWFVTNHSPGAGPTGNQLRIDASPGTINGESDLIISSEAGLGVSNTINGVGHIVSEYQTGLAGTNSYVNTASFAGAVLSLGRVGLSGLTATMPAATASVAGSMSAADKTQLDTTPKPNREQIKFIFGDVTITTANLADYNRQFLIANGNPGTSMTITIAEDVELDYFWYHVGEAGGLVIQTQNLERINDQQSHTFVQNNGGLIKKFTEGGQYALFAYSGATTDDFVKSGSFAANILSLQREESSDVDVPLDLNDVDGSVAGLPIDHSFSLVSNAVTQQVVNFGTQALQWTALNGGKLGLRFQLYTQSSGGFLPEMLSLKLDYGTISFTFPLGGHEIDQDGVVELTIADLDYSAILNSDPTVTLTVNFRGFSYSGRFEFKELYNRETSLIHDDVERIADNSSGQVLHQLLPLIESDEANIVNLQAAVKALIQMIDNLPQAIPPAVLSWLINDVTITETTSTTLDPTRFNMFLANDQTQAIFVDPDQTVSGGDQLTGIIKDGLVRGQKMYELIMGTYADGDVMVHAFDGTNQTDLIKRTGDNVVAIKYVPAHGGGSRTVTEYPLPPNQFHHEWYRISLSTGAPNFEPVSSEIAFTQNVPLVSTTITILVRTVANGNVGATTTRTLAGVGGSADVSDSFSLAVGPESIDVQTRWDASRQTIYVSGNPHVSGLAIADLEVGVSYEVTETAPITPETTQEIPIARYIAGTSIVMLFEPSLSRVDSDASTMIIHTDTANVNTDYLFNTLFGTTDGGHLTVTSAAGQPSSWYDWNKFTPNQETITQISDRIMLPYLGWFVQNFNQETLANFDTQLTVRNADDDEIKAGQESVLTSPSGDRYRQTIDNSGLTTWTKIT